MLNLKKKVKVDWRIFVLMIIGIIFIAIYSYLAFNLPASWNSQPKLIQNSPDETSNLFFAYQMADQTSLQFKDGANEIAQGLVAPRSMRVINGYTVPAGFLGLPIIYGTIAKITGSCFIPFLTPIIATIGLIFFYLLLKLIFNKNTAFISTLFAFILPPFWYYSTKSMMPNAAFASFFIIALYFFVKIIMGANCSPMAKCGCAWRSALTYAAFGFFLALSLMIRTSEIVWMAPLFIILTIINYKKISFKFLVLSFIIFLITFLPIFHFNEQIYGNPLSLGYDLGIDLQNKNIIGQGATVAGKLLLPFGFHPRLALENLYNYTFKIFPFWSILVLLGFLIFSFKFLILNFKSSITKRKKKAQLIYLILFIITSAYLAIYYGSWPFNDNPNPDLITIGTSYIRYWLPIYLFVLPFLGFSITLLFKKSKAAQLIVAVLIFLFLSIASFRLVMLDKEEGIFQVKANLSKYQNIAAKVIKQTENNSIIIADTMDKVFFPSRRVIFRLNTNQSYDTIKKLVGAGYPVYYFYFTRTGEQLAEFNQRYFKSHGLIVEKSVLDFEEQSLYPVKVIR